MKLKAGQIYLHREYFGSHDLGVIRRERCIFRDRRKNNWEMDFGDSVYPQELNRGFLKDIKENYVLIGEL